MAHNCHSNSKLLTAHTKIFTAITNNSQHKPRYSQRKSRNSQQKQMTQSTNQNVHSNRKTGSLDLRTPGSLGPLRPRGHPFQNNKHTKCKWCHKGIELKVPDGQGENRQDFSMATLQTFTKSFGVIPVEILICVSNFFESER